MKTKALSFGISLLCIILFIQTVSFSQSVWETKYMNNIGGNYLRRIQFLNSFTGYAGGGNGIFLKSINSGETWNVINTGNSGFIVSIFFLNENTGWLGSTLPMIQKTTDGGNTWIDQPIVTSSYIADIYFVNDQTGFAAGNGGEIFKTVNGGANWNDISQVSMAWGEVQFLNENTGWILADNDLYKTSNGGSSWTSIMHNNNGSTGYFQDYHFINELTGWATIPNGVAKTIDGGESWSFTGIPMGRPMAIKFLDANLGWCVGYDNHKGIICRTLNGGINWTVQSVEKNNRFYDVSFVNRNEAWTCGNTIVSGTENGAYVSISQISTSVPETFSLKQNYPNPFNPSTKINFNIKKATSASLTISDVNGREVKSLVYENIAPGTYEINFNAGQLTSGVYFYTLKTNDFAETKKMTLVK